METVYLSLSEASEKEFKNLFENHSKRLYTIACRHISPSDAGDIVQELFIEIWEKRQTIRVRSSWEGYLYSVLKYRIFRFLDRKNQLDQSLAEALHEIGDTEEILSFEELYSMLDETLNSLPKQCRSIFEKKYYENKKSQEIADELGISVETVKTQLKRGLKIIRFRMKDSLVNFMFL